MKKLIISALLLMAGFACLAQESDDFYKLKLARRQNLTVRQWNTDAKSKTRWLDHETVYDAQGRKVSEAEYNQFGVVWRETYEYGDNDRIVKEVRYDGRNKPVYIRKYEYDEKNRKAKQYNYSPAGKLVKTKVYEYLVSEQ